MYILYPRVNCLKTIPFTAAHTYIAHIWQYPPPPPPPPRGLHTLRKSQMTAHPWRKIQKNWECFYSV